MTVDFFWLFDGNDPLWGPQGWNFVQLSCLDRNEAKTTEGYHWISNKLSNKHLKMWFNTENGTGNKWKSRGVPVVLKLKPCLKWIGGQLVSSKNQRGACGTHWWGLWDPPKWECLGGLLMQGRTPSLQVCLARCRAHR